MTLPPASCPVQRDTYIRHVSSTEGLAALAAAVVRNASSVLKVGGAGTVLRGACLALACLLQQRVSTQGSDVAGRCIHTCHPCCTPFSSCHMPGHLQRRHVGHPQAWRAGALGAVAGSRGRWAGNAPWVQVTARRRAAAAILAILPRRQICQPHV